VVAGGDLPQKKPDPAPLLHIAHRLDVPAAALVMVGDGAQDIEAARRAGARGVGVEGGIQPREHLLRAKPDTMLRSLSELPDLIRSWQQ
jgi:phosphoglycolate phosphatase